MDSGSVGTEHCITTAPWSSTTHTAVSSIDTSSPAKWALAVIPVASAAGNWRLQSTVCPGSDGCVVAFRAERRCVMPDYAGSPWSAPPQRLGPTAKQATNPARARWNAISLIGDEPPGEVHEEALRLRRERREIDNATDAWRSIWLHLGGSQFGDRRGLSVCVANSVARAHAIRSKEATVRSSGCRPPIIGESIAI